MRRILPSRWTANSSLIKKLRSAEDPYYRVGRDISDGQIEDCLDQLAKEGLIESKYDPKTRRFSWRLAARTNPTAKQHQRGLAWSSLRHELRQTRGDEKKVRSARAKRLTEAREECERERAAVTVSCKRRRERIRTDARQALAKLAARRSELRKFYADKFGSKQPRSWQRRYSKSESDSLAEHNIPDRLLPVWRSMRAQFSYAKAPDARAVAFLEWVGEHEAEVDRELIDRFETSDAELAELEREYYEQQMAS